MAAYERRQYQQAQERSNVRLSKDPRIESWYQHYFRFHALFALMTLASVIVIWIFIGIGDLNTKYYWTNTFLNQSPPASEFGLTTEIEIMRTAHLYWFFFIPLAVGLYSLFLVLPYAITRYFVPLVFQVSPGYLEDITPAEFDSEKMRKPAGGVYETSTGHAKSVNPIFTLYFNHHVRYGHVGVKYIPYGFAMGMYAIMCAVLVGVTDFFLQVFIFFLAFNGFLQLMIVESRNTTEIRDAHRQANATATRDSDRSGGGTYLLGEQESGDKSLIPEDIEEVGEKFAKLLTAIVFPYNQVYIAIGSLLAPHVVIIPYFAHAVSENSSGLPYYSYVAVLVYIILTVLHCVLILLHYHHILTQYLLLEMLTMLLFVLTVTVVPLIVIFGSHNHFRMFGIIVP